MTKNSVSSIKCGEILKHKEMHKDVQCIFYYVKNRKKSLLIG